MYQNFEFDPSAGNAKTLASAILAWWREAQFETYGERGERNVYDEAPSFVAMAQKMLGQDSDSSYLEVCRARFKELTSLLNDYETIAGNSDVEPQQRFQLVMAPACKGRILELFDAMNTPVSLDSYDPRILGYESCISLTKSEFDAQMRSLKALFAGQAD